MDARDTTTGGPNNIEIAYNNVHHQVGGRGIQIFGDTGTLINNVRIHHNLVHHIALDGIILSADTGVGMQVYNNVVYHTADPTLLVPGTDSGQSGGCLRFAGGVTGSYNPVVPTLEAEVYNNTFVDCAADNDPDSALLRIQYAKKLTIRNNILGAPGMINWLQDTSGSGQHASNADVLNILNASNNLWVGSTPPTWDSSPVTGDPMFVDAAARNYHVLSGSPAIDRGSSLVNTVVRTDYDGVPRPQGTGFDIGAYEQ